MVPGCSGAHLHHRLLLRSPVCSAAVLCAEVLSSTVKTCVSWTGLEKTRFDKVWPAYAGRLFWLRVRACGNSARPTKQRSVSAACNSRRKSMSISCKLQVGTLTPLPPSLILSYAPPPHPTLPTAASPQFMRSILITSISALSAGVEHLCYCT